MNLTKYTILILPIIFFSCTSDYEREEFDNPAWVAEKFYESFTKNDFETAAYYCDKPSKNSLEAYSYVATYVPEQKFISVDSCDLYEEHAYCYCKLADEDSVEQTEKLLLRNYRDIWKVHFTKGGNGENKESALYDYKAKLNKNAPHELSALPELEKENLDSTLKSVIRIISDQNMVVGFLNESELYNVDYLAKREYDYDDYLVRRDEFEAMRVIYKYFFADEVLYTLEVTVTDFHGDNKYEKFQYILEGISTEFGLPYNMEKVKEENWYKYKEVKWFLNGYNEELLISIVDNNVVISLIGAY